MTFDLKRNPHKTMNLCTFCINEGNSMFSVVVVVVCFLMNCFYFFINLKYLSSVFMIFFSYAGNDLTFRGSKIEVLNFFFFTFVTYVTSVFSTFLIKL